MALLCLLLIFTGVFADNPVPVMPTGNDLTYNSTDQVLLDTSNASYPGYETIYCRFSADTGKAWQDCSDIKGKDAGEYSVDFFFSNMPDAASADPNTTKTGTVIVTIKKAEPVYTQPGQLDNGDLNYSGTAQNLLKDLGSITAPENGRWIFFVKFESGSGSQPTTTKVVHSMPTGKDVGKYTVGYYLYNNGDNNYSNWGAESDLQGNYEVNINPAQVEIGFTIDGNPATTDPEISYDAANHPIGFTAKTESEEDVTRFLKLTLEKDGEAFTGEPKDFGTYKATVSLNEDVEGSENYSLVDSNPTLTLTIKKALVKVAVTGREVTAVYDGKVHTTVYDMEVTEDESGKYSLNDVKFVGTKYRVDETDADTNPYPLTLLETDFKNTNENFDVTFSVTSGSLTITPAVVSLTWGETEFTYDGKSHVPEATAGNLAAGDSCTVTVTGEQTNAGENYQATAVDLSNANYQLPPESERATTFKINPAKPEVVDPEPLDNTTLTYNEAPQNLMKNIGSHESFEEGRWMFWTSYDGGEPTLTVDGMPKGTEPGTYVVSWYFYNNEIKNYTNIGSKADPVGTSTVTIEKAKIDVSFTLDDKDVSEDKTINYDGNDHNIGLKGSIGETDQTDKLKLIIMNETTETSCDNPLKNAGIYTAAATVDEEFKNHYDLSDPNASFTLTINKIPVTVSFTIDDIEVSGDQTKVFDNNNHPINFTAKTESGDDVSALMDWTYTKNGQPETNAPKDAAEYVLSVALGEEAVNYTLDPAPSQKLTITPAEVNVTWKVSDEPVEGSSKSIVYDSQEHPITFTAIADDDTNEGKGTDITVKLNLSIKKDGEDFHEAIIPAGTYTAGVTVDPEAANNYVLSDSYSDFTLTIEKAPVTVTFTIDDIEVSGDQTKVFDDGEHPINFTAKTEFEADVRESLTWTYTKNGQPETNAPKDAAEYVLSVALGEEAVNYTLDPAPSQKLTITPAEVNVTWKVNDEPVEGSSKSIGYDSLEHPITFTAIADDDTNEGKGTDITDKLILSIKKDNEPFSAAIIPAGIYTASVTVDPEAANNYVLSDSYSDFTLTIGKTPVTVTVTGREVTAVYDGEEHTTVYDMDITEDASGKYSLDYVDFVGTKHRVDEINVGTYPLTLSDKDFVNTNENFTVTFVVTSGSLTIEPAEVTVTLEGVSHSTVYDGEVHGAWFVVKSIQINGEDTTLYTADDFGPAEGAFTRYDKSDDGKTVVVIAEKNAGKYTMTLTADKFKNNKLNEDGSSNFNVTFAFASAELGLEITKKPVTLDWKSPESFLYTGKVHGPTAGSITINGLENGEKQEDVATITVTGSPMTDAGKYVAMAEVTFDPANYELSKDAKTEFPYAIKKATITVDPAPVLKSGPLPYTGNYQALLETLGGLTCNNNADPCPGSIIYVINGQWKTNPDENPSADAVGEYTVSYYVTNYDTANYDCAADETHPVEIGKITIRPAYATITVQDGLSFPYTGENLRPDITVTYEDGTSDTYPYGNNPQKLKITVTPSNSYPNAGTYTIKVESNDPNMSADPVTAQFEITKVNYTDNSASGDVEAPNSFAVIPIEGLVYNCDFQNLVRVEWNENTSGTIMFAVVDENGELVAKTVPDRDDFLPSAVAKNAGTYAIYYYVIPDENHNAFPTDADYAGPVYAAIAKADLADAVITLDPAVLPFTGEEITVNPQVTFNGFLLTPGVDYEISGNTGIAEKNYMLTITAVEGSNFFGQNSLQWRIRDIAPNRIDMFRIGQPEEVCLRCGILGSELPATGLPTRVDVPLAVRPEGLNYTNLNMRIQIPTIDVDVELEGVPTMDGAWKVEWLADNAGLLSGTALPGDGYSIVAAHNTLNAEEYGPFALLSTLENNDTIFVNAPDGSLRLFRVYANELMAPNDMEKLASVAEQEMNTLVLVTCENESVDGGYLNRRVVFAKPLN